MQIDEYVKKARELSDSYERTIQAIVAFDSAVRYDDKQGSFLEQSFRLPGRKMSKSNSGNDDTVTPDIVEQLSSVYGIIGEVKLTASTQQDFEKAEEQIKNYDRDLIGWRTENEKINLHDISLLVNDLKKNIAQRFFIGKVLQRKLTLIACALQTELKAVYKIEKYYGTFSDARLEEKMRDPIPIPLEKEEIIKAISSIKFYDAEPPIEYAMNVLWMNIFNEICQQEGNPSTKAITVRCKEITKMLSERYSFDQIDARQPKIPREAWIRGALNAFVSIRLAEKDISDTDKYLIKYSHPRKENMIEFFARKNFEALNKAGKKKTNSNQLEFPNIAGKIEK
jgi:hypothetical protein